MGVEVTFVDAQNLKETEGAFRENTAVYFFIINSFLLKIHI